MACPGRLTRLLPDREGPGQLGGHSPEPEQAGGQRAHPVHQRTPGEEQQGWGPQIHPPPLTSGCLAQAHRPRSEEHTSELQSR